MTIGDLPAVNASLNALSTLFIIVGWLFVRRQYTRQHIISMSCALLTSTLFLICYLTYHFNVVAVTRFTAQGVVRPIYFTLLLTHVVLAVVTVPLVIATVVPAVQARYDRHRRLARWTLPIWLYVSVTGVVIYLMLYQWFPPVAGSN